MAKRVKLKEDFGESFFTFYQDVFGLNSKNQDNKNSEGHSNPIPE